MGREWSLSVCPGVVNTMYRKNISRTGGRGGGERRRSVTTRSGPYLSIHITHFRTRLYIKDLEFASFEFWTDGLPTQFKIVPSKSGKTSGLLLPNPHHYCSQHSYVICHLFASSRNPFFEDCVTSPHTQCAQSLLVLKH